MPLDLHTTTDEATQAVVLTVLGEVDIATIDQLESKIDSLDEPRTLVIDLTATDFMDSTALRLLITAHERFRESGREIKVAVEAGPISRLLEVTGVMGQLNAFSSVDSALRS